MEGPTLIAGCGYVGSRLALDLLGNSSIVLGLRRDVSKLPPGVVPVAADLASPGPLPVVPDLEAIVYLPSAGERTEAAYRRAYVDGVDRLADALGSRSASTRRAIFVSSTSVFGDVNGDVDETTPPSPSGFSGRLLLEGEARFRARFPGAIVVRFAGIYGPGRGRLVRQVRDGGPFDSSDETIGNRIHREDCAGALAHLLTTADVQRLHPLYVGVDDAPVALGDVRAFIADRLGLGADVSARHRAHGPPIGKRLSNARLRASGFAFSVPTYREGYAGIVDEVTRSG